MWNDLAENTLEEVQHSPNALWNDDTVDPYLRYFLVSHEKQKAKWPDLWGFLDTSMNEQQKRDYLESGFISDLAFIAVSRNEFDRARFYVNKFYQQFVKKWSSLHPLAVSARYSQLQPVQQMVEIEEFLEFMSEDRKRLAHKRCVVWSRSRIFSLLFSIPLLVLLFPCFLLFSFSLGVPSSLPTFSLLLKNIWFTPSLEESFPFCQT
jgi:hypothetical protein